MLPGEIEADITSMSASVLNDSLVDRIWAKDASVWTSSGEENWLGWLDIVGRESNDTAKYDELSKEIAEAAFDDIVLMGMGGSSLCPEVLATTIGNERFHILDSTVPAQVLSLHRRIDPARTLFIVASKSGSTLEPNCFFAYFYDVVASLVGTENAGQQFIAITDPGSKMEQAARDHGFRKIIFGESTVGGRFSALSPFGLTAAALVGFDVTRFLAKADAMTRVCRSTDLSINDGARLGIYLAACHAAGRDKLTVFASGRVSTLGAWMEQLIAESTGKNGVAIIPVDGEPLAAENFDKYGNDRAFVFLSMGEDREYAQAANALLEHGHPCVSIAVSDEYDLASEFFKWEFATAVAGSLMRIDPFDQPDVESAKIEARKLTDEYESTGSLPSETPCLETDDLAFYNSGSANAELANGISDAASLIARHLGRINSGDYFALLAYVEMTNETREILRSICNSVLNKTGAATCLGFGPRFLHSTGQAYKGGPNSGVFLQITADDPEDIAVPGREFKFGVVAAAQARGDLQVLADRDRRALRIHIKGELIAGLREISAMTI